MHKIEHSPMNTLLDKEFRMDELIKLVVEKTGIPEAQAEVAVKTVIKFLMDKFPEPVDTLLGNFLEDEDGVTNLVAGLSGLFNK